MTCQLLPISEKSSNVIIIKIPYTSQVDKDLNILSRRKCEGGNETEWKYLNDRRSTFCVENYTVF